MHERALKKFSCKFYEFFGGGKNCINIMHLSDYCCFDDPNCSIDFCPFYAEKVNPKPDYSSINECKFNESIKYCRFTDMNNLYKLIRTEKDEIEKEEKEHTIIVLDNYNINVS